MLPHYTVEGRLNDDDHQPNETHLRHVEAERQNQQDAGDGLDDEPG